MKLSLSTGAKRMIALIAGQCLVIIAGSAVYFRGAGFLPFAYGVLLACALNCGKVLLIERTVKRAAQGSLGAWGGTQYLVRFLLTGAVLVLAAVIPFINLWGAAAGVLTYQVALFSMRRGTREDEAN